MMSWSNRRSQAFATTMDDATIMAGEAQPTAQRLKLLAQSLSAMVQQLETALENEDETVLGPAPAFPALHAPSTRVEPHVQGNVADLAQKAYRDRRRRAEVFGEETLFGEPAWDILLDLFVAGEKGKRVAVTSACIGSGVPSTTALRWLNVLELRGLIEREDDNSDARRSFVRLTSKARRLMAEYFLHNAG
jgi:hypothetical protein